MRTPTWSAFYQEASKADDDGTPLEITRYVPTFPATPHQLFLIPGGTPHGSGRAMWCSK